MKIFGIGILTLITLCPFASAQKWPSVFERGFSDQYRSENTLGEYVFGYNEDHTTGGSFRRETSDRHGNKIGSYGLRIADGRMRVVNYVADHNGYRADVISNEPGMSHQYSNGYITVSKKNIQEVLIPGFSYSSDPPHVSFDTDERKEQIIDGQQTDQIAPFPASLKVSSYAVANEIVDEVPFDASPQPSGSKEMKMETVQEEMAREREVQTVQEEMKVAADETALMESQIKASHDEGDSKILEETNN